MSFRRSRATNDVALILFLVLIILVVGLTLTYG